MRLHFLVEGTSEQKFLEGLLPRLIPNHTFAIYPHQGKGRIPDNTDDKPERRQRGVLDLLPAKLRGWGKSLSPETDRVVLLVDLDDGDCTALLERLAAMLETIDPAPSCLFRIAIEEMEAWYLGDWNALKQAFPKANKASLKGYAQDSICGTWELLQQVIADPVDRKTTWAEKMGAVLDVTESGRSNKSPSFRKFCEGVRRLAGDDTEKPRAQKKEVSLRARTAAKKRHDKR